MSDHFDPYGGQIGPFGNARFERKTLDQLKVGMSILSSATYDVAPDGYFEDQLRHKLEAYVLAEKLADDRYSNTKTETLEFPASWWQHLKRDHAPEWFRRRWPVRLTYQDVTAKVEVRVERYVGYPEANVAVPPLGRPVIYEQVTRR